MIVSVVLSTISIFLCVFFFFFFRLYIDRKTSAREHLADYRSEVHRLIADIDTVTDRDSLLVEERIKTLKQLLEDTDRRIAVYVRELQRSKKGEQIYASLGKGIRVAMDSASQDAASAEPVSPAERVLPADLAPAANPDLFGTETIAPSGRPAKNARKRNRNVHADESQEITKPTVKLQVAELSAKGLNPHEIASQLRLSIAEVDLALNLLKRT